MACGAAAGPALRAAARRGRRGAGATLRWSGGSGHEGEGGSVRVEGGVHPAGKALLPLRGREGGGGEAGRVTGPAARRDVRAGPLLPVRLRPRPPSRPAVRGARAGARGLRGAR